MNTSPPRKQTPNRPIIPAAYPVILPSSRIGKDAYVGQCQKIAPAVSRATAAMVKQKKNGQDLGATGKHARVSDPIEIPLRPDQTNLLAMIGARAAMSRASLDATHPQGHARKARRGKKRLPRASIRFQARAGTSVLRPAWWASRVMPCPGRSAKIEVLATEHRERRGRGAVSAPASGHQEHKIVPFNPIGTAADHPEA